MDSKNDKNLGQFESNEQFQAFAMDSIERLIAVNGPLIRNLYWQLFAEYEHKYRKTDKNLEHPDSIIVREILAHEQVFIDQMIDDLCKILLELMVSWRKMEADVMELEKLKSKGK